MLLALSGEYSDVLISFDRTPFAGSRAIVEASRKGTIGLAL
jgi:hypothetical protein